MDAEYPVTNQFLAKEVTDLNFRIEPNGPLYVNLDAVRGDQFLAEMSFDLHYDYEQDCLMQRLNHFAKMLFSGHRGSGKSMELQRFHQKINHSKGYASIMIDMEREVELYSFKAEDFFILLITKLIERLDELEIQVAGAEAIAQEWLSETEVMEEVKRLAKQEVSGEAGAGYDFFGLLKLKSAYKSLFSGESSSAKKIRQIVKNNPKRLIDQFNVVLGEARERIAEKGRGRDLIFVLDGSEKVPLEIYQQIFVDDPELIRSINANLLCAVPINTYFDISVKARSDFNTYLLPVMEIGEDAQKIEQFAKVISSRVDCETFIEPDALGYAVKMSGGSPRQLLRIFNRALIQRLGRKIHLADCEQTCRRLGQEMRDLLTSEHVKVLQSGEWRDADPAVLDMVFSLVLLKYNGHKRINPLVADFLES